MSLLIHQGILDVLPGHSSIWPISDEAKSLTSFRPDVDELKGSEMRQANNDERHFLRDGVLRVIENSRITLSKL